MPSISKFYLHNAATSDAGTLPNISTSISAKTPDTTSAANFGNKSMDDGVGASQASITLTTIARTTAQSDIFYRWLSAPLAAQTISAQNWTFRIAALESNAASNMFLGLVIAVWRPSTGALVGRIYDGPNAAAALGTEPGTTETAEAVMTVAGSAITVQAGDILCVEVWSISTQSMASNYTQTIYYDGTTEGSATSQAAYVAPTTAVTMLGTQLYLRSAANSGGPTVTQNGQDGILGSMAHSLAATKGTTQTSAQGTVDDGTTIGTQGMIAAFVSKPLNGAQTIPAGSISASVGIDATGTGNNPKWGIYAYVYRPSTSTVVGTLDTSGATHAGVTSSEAWASVSDSQSSVAAANGDVIVVEIWVSNGSIAVGVSNTFDLYWEGGTEGSSTDAASYIVIGGVLLSFQTGGTQAITPGAISATSTFGGYVSAPRRPTPAAVSATSTVAGGIRVIRRVAPAQISATATVSGNVTALKRITPAAISATSAVSGAVARLKQLVAAAISATSTVTGKVTAIHRIGGAISATSVVSGTVTARRKIAGAISATSTVSGLVGVIRRIAPGQILATSTLSGNIGRRRPITPGAISAASVVSGALRVIRRIAPGGISATSTLSGTVTDIHAGKFISGAINATSTLAGSVSKWAAIVGAVSATSTVSGALRVIRRVTGAITATSTVTGSVRVLRRIAGAVAATAVVSGSVVARRRILPAQISATSVVSGTIKIQGKISGVITATSIVTGNVVARRRIIGAVTATSTVTGTIRVIRAIKPTVISATSTVTGKVTRIVYPAGAIFATSTLSGRVGAIRPLGIGAISATSLVSGSLAVGRAIIGGNIFATSTVAGSIRAIPASGGAILATSVVSGTVRVGQIVYGRTVPRIVSGEQLAATVTSTSTDSAVLISADGNTPRMTSSTDDEIPTIERAR